MPAFGGLDWIDVADDVRDSNVGRGKLLHEARIPGDPFDVRHVAMQVEQLAAIRRDRIEGIVVDLGAGDNGNSFVEQRSQLPNDSALRLAAQAEQNEVMPRQDGVDELWNDRFVVTNDTGKQFFTDAQLLNEVRA